MGWGWKSLRRGAKVIGLDIGQKKKPANPAYDIAREQAKINRGRALEDSKTLVKTSQEYLGEMIKNSEKMQGSYIQAQATGGQIGFARAKSTTSAKPAVTDLSVEKTEEMEAFEEEFNSLVEASKDNEESKKALDDFLAEYNEKKDEMDSGYDEMEKAVIDAYLQQEDITSRQEELTAAEEAIKNALKLLRKENSEGEDSGASEGYERASKALIEANKRLKNARSAVKQIPEIEKELKINKEKIQLRNLMKEQLGALPTSEEIELDSLSAYGTGAYQKSIVQQNTHMQSEFTTMKNEIAGQMVSLFREATDYSSEIGYQNRLQAYEDKLAEIAEKERQRNQRFGTIMGMTLGVATAFAGGGGFAAMAAQGASGGFSAYSRYM